MDRNYNSFNLPSVMETMEGVVLKARCLILPALLALPLAGQALEPCGYAWPAGGSQAQPRRLEATLALATRPGSTGLARGLTLLRAPAGLATEPGTVASIDETRFNPASFGLMVRIRTWVVLAAGLEHRFEALSLASPAAGLRRPWARVNVGLAIPAAALRPFLGVEAALPMAVTPYRSPRGAGDAPEEQVKALEPRGQIGLYGGIRF